VTTYLLWGVGVEAAWLKVVLLVLLAWGLIVWYAIMGHAPIYGPFLFVLVPYDACQWVIAALRRKAAGPRRPTEPNEPM
jgi:hypothetical protein